MQAAPLDHMRERAGFAASVPIHVLDLYIDDAAVSHQIEDLLQGWNRCTRKRGVEADAGVDSGELGQCVGAKGAGAGGCTFEAEVMQHDQFAVGGRLYIEFDAVDPHFEGFLEGRKRVLRREGIGAAVGKYQWKSRHDLTLSGLLQAPLGFAADGRGPRAVNGNGGTLNLAR